MCTYVHNSDFTRAVSRPGFRDRDPGIPGRDSFPFPPLFLPGEPGRALVVLVVLYRQLYRIVPVQYLGFCVITDNFSLIPVSLTIPGSLPSHLRDIPNPGYRPGAGRDRPLLARAFPA